MSRRLLKSALLWALLLSVPQYVFGENTPGGALPKDNPWSLDRDASISLDIPRVAERALGGGPQISVAAFELSIDQALAATLTPELSAQIEQVVEQQRQAKTDNKFTISEMEQVAGVVTNLLRDQGYIVAYAYLPTQQVENGRVEMAVLSGALGKVVVEGNEVLSAQRIGLAFNYLVGRPLQKAELESAILRLRDYPGLAPAAVLGPGEAVGTSDLTVRVTERRYNVHTMLDNYGSEATGETRARIKLDWNSPLRRGDRLTFNVLQTFDPADGTYGGVSYVTPIGSRGFFAGAMYDENTFDVRGGALDISGESETSGIFARQTIKRSRELNMDVGLDLTNKKTQFDPFLGVQQEDELSVLGVSFNLEAVDRLGPLGVNLLNVGYYHGLPDFLGAMDEDGIGDGGQVSTRIGANGERAGGDFDKFTLRYQRHQRINLSNAVLFRAFGQWTDDLLTSIEQMTLGGPYSVRAYPNAQQLVDRGAFGSLEYTYNAASWLENRMENWDVNLSLFYDYAWGELISPFASEMDTVNLGGYGAGAHFEYRWGAGNGLVVRAEVAAPTSSLDPDNDRDPQYWLRFEYFRR